MKGLLTRDMILPVSMQMALTKLLNGPVIHGGTQVLEGSDGGFFPSFFSFLFFPLSPVFSLPLSHGYMKIDSFSLTYTKNSLLQNLDPRLRGEAPRRQGADAKVCPRGDAGVRGDGRPADHRLRPRDGGVVPGG